MIKNNAFPGMTLQEAFTKSTDGEGCPISRYNISENFIAICNEADFETEFIGGYFNKSELIWLKKFKDEALKSSKLNQEHKIFLSNLTYDENGYPLYNGKYAGIGGVYELYKN